MKSDRKGTARNHKVANNIPSESSHAVVAIMPTPIYKGNMNGDSNSEERKGSGPSTMFKTPNNPRWLGDNGF